MLILSQLNNKLVAMHGSEAKLTEPGSLVSLALVDLLI